jgi:hypothetical protein
MKIAKAGVQPMIMAKRRVSQDCRHVNEEGKVVRTHGALKHRPQKHPFRFWCGRLAAAINTQPNDTKGGECDANEAAAEEHEYANLLDLWHLEIPCETNWEKHY